MCITNVASLYWSVTSGDVKRTVFSPLHGRTFLHEIFQHCMYLQSQPESWHRELFNEARSAFWGRFDGGLLLDSPIQTVLDVLCSRGWRRHSDVIRMW